MSDTCNEVEKNRQFWPSIKQQVQRKMNLSKISYLTWIHDLTLESVNQGRVIITVPSADSAVRVYIAERYTSCFQDAIANHTGERYKIEFVLKTDFMQITHGKTVGPEVK